MVIILLASYESKAQFFDPQELETVLETLAEESDISPVYDQFEQYIENPINLHTAEISDLMCLPGISYSLAYHILKTAQHSKPFFYDMLYDSTNISKEQMYVLQLCTFYFDENRRRKNVLLRERLNHRFTSLRGFEEGKYLGDELDLYQRLVGYYDNYSLTLLARKNAGEKSVLDFSSGNFRASFQTLDLILGDYYIESGMGSLLWKEFGNRKSAYVSAADIALGSGIKPYRSSLDYGYFRGIALKKDFLFGSNKVSAQLWFSSAPRSATVDSTEDIVRSVYTGLYYRTETETAKKNTLNERAYGGSAEYSSERFIAGVNLLALDYSKEIASSSIAAFKGKSGLLMSFHSLWRANDNNSIAFEIAKDAKNNPSLKAAYSGSFGRTEIISQFRSFDYNFRSPYGYIFGETYAPANELGLYTGIRNKISNELYLMGYIDIYRTYGKTYYVPEKVRGIDFTARAEYYPAKSLNLAFQTKAENKTDAATIEDAKKIFQSTKYLSRGELTYHILKNLRMKMRVDFCLLDMQKFLPTETGIAAYVDFRYDFVETVRAGLRQTYFSTDSYGSAIWQFESPIPGYMLTAPLYYSGIRTNAYLNFYVADIATVRFWAIYMKKYNGRKIGSGFNETLGSEDIRGIFQLDVKI